MKNITLLLKAQINNGRILWRDPVMAAGVINQYNGREVDITIAPPRKDASSNQRNYYWGVIIPILMKDLGYAKMETHEILKSLFLPREKEVAGVTVKYSGSTEELSTTEKEEYHSDIREWASTELNCWIPLPNEVA